MADEQPRPRYMMATIRRCIEVDREHDAQASKGWSHTHSTVIRNSGQKIVANMWTPRAPRRPSDLLNATAGAPQTFKGWETDPAYELKDGRFIAYARQALPYRAGQLEHLADLLDAVREYAGHKPDCAREPCDCGWTTVEDDLAFLYRKP